MEKVILITGGSDGLGKAIAECLATKYRVVILARDKKKLEEVAKKLNCRFLVCDITDQKQVEKAINGIIKEFGQIDCLINNAGVFIEGHLEDNQPDKIREVIDINVVGTILVTRAVLLHMKRNGSGLIININSRAGLLAKPERSIYNTSKWAITGFTKCMQLELGATGIKIVGIYPGKMNTKIFKKAGIAKNMKNAVDPREVAKVVEFILERDEKVLVSDVSIIHKDDF